MILTETKVSGSKAKDIYDKLPFDGAFHANNFVFFLVVFGFSGTQPKQNCLFSLL